MENQNTSLNQAPIISVGEWVVAFILMAIPLVNLIVLLIWAFGSTNNPSKANWAKAALLFMVIAFALWFIVLGSIFSSFI
jgi:uncharacterized membrane protein YqjE